MDTLIVIGLVLAVVTALCAVVYEMAEARGRHRWAWALAALVGLAFVLVGWAVVVTVLVLVGPARVQGPQGYRDTAPVDSRA